MYSQSTSKLNSSMSQFQLTVHFRLCSQERPDTASWQTTASRDLCAARPTGAPVNETTCSWTPCGDHTRSTR